MKSAQWTVAFCVLAAMVFAITFAVNYVGGWGGRARTPKPAEAQARLTFADEATSFPMKSDAPPAECEIKRPQTRDFWFKNENSQSLPIGVFDKSCQCTSVKVWIAPDSRKDVPAPEDRDQAVKDLEAAGAPTELKEKDAVVTAPAAAVGVVRVAWKSDRPGPKTLTADLWMGDKSGSQQRFEIRTMGVGPLKVAGPEIDVGELTRDQLPHALSVRCWSSTRSQFPLDARVLQNRLTRASNPFAAGKPVPLTEEELAQLRKDPKNGAVLAGYRVSVIFWERSPDETTPFDLGVFRQRIELTTEDSEPLRVILSGTVLGDLAVVSASPGPVDLGKFDSPEAVKREVVVESEAEVARLELDRQRTPDFLDVEFPDGPATGGSRKTWKLQVKWVPSSQAGGKFPRDEDEYRDSAVYIKPVYATPGGAPPSSLRIPVMGIADTQ